MSHVIINTRNINAGKDQLSLRDHANILGVQYSAVQYSIVQCSAVRYSTVQYSTRPNPHIPRYRQLLVSYDNHFPKSTFVNLTMNCYKDGFCVLVQNEFLILCVEFREEEEEECDHVRGSVLDT